MVNNETTIFSAINEFVEERFNVKNIDLVSISQIEQGIEKAPYNTFLRMLYVLKLVLLQKNGESGVDIEKVIAENEFFFYQHLWFSHQIQNFTSLIQESKIVSVEEIETKKNIKADSELAQKKEVIQSESKKTNEDIESTKKKIVVTNRPGIKIIAPKNVAIDARKKETKKDEIEIGQKKSFTTTTPIIKTLQQKEKEIKKSIKEIPTTATAIVKIPQQKTTEIKEQKVVQSEHVGKKESPTTVAAITKTFQQKTTEIKEQKNVQSADVVEKEIPTTAAAITKTSQQKATEIKEQKNMQSADVVEKEIPTTAAAITKTSQQKATEIKEQKNMQSADVVEKEIPTTAASITKTPQQKITEIKEQKITKSADVIEKEMKTTVAAITKTSQQKTTEIKEQKNVQSADVVEKEIPTTAAAITKTSQQKATEIKEQKNVQSADVVEKEIPTTAAAITETQQQKATEIKVDNQKEVIKSKGIVETKIIPTPSTIATSDDKMSTSSIHREKITPKIPVKEFTIKKDNNNINKALKEIESNENKLSKTKNGSIEEKKEEKTIPPTITSSMVTKTRVDIIENKPKHFNEWLSAYSKNVKPSTISEPKKNIYTETMADLYIKQGNIAQAIKIYEELIELYPEKKIYFTQKITPLKNL